jgi:Na+/melibiose symporter-like transporter
MTLAGVLIASVLPAYLSYNIISVLLAILLIIAIPILLRIPMPTKSKEDKVSPPTTTPKTVWKVSAFRSLLLVFLLNGTASAIPATLLPFYVSDVLRLDLEYRGLFLVIYFVTAALAVPLWAKLTNYMDLITIWFSGMVLAIIGFLFVFALGPGD